MLNAPSRLSRPAIERHHQWEDTMPEPTPLALTDSQIRTIMQLARPLLPDQRAAFSLF
jgi:hypothetical protein